MDNNNFLPFDLPAVARKKVQETIRQHSSLDFCVTIVCMLSRLVPLGLVRRLSQRHFREGPAALQRKGNPSSSAGRAWSAPSREVVGGWMMWSQAE